MEQFICSPNVPILLIQENEITTMLLYVMHFFYDLIFPTVYLKLTDDGVGVML
jgi:hypothetical protein